MPRLDVLAEDEAELGLVFVQDQRHDVAVDGEEHLGGEGTDEVKV